MPNHHRTTPRHQPARAFALLEGVVSLATLGILLSLLLLTTHRSRSLTHQAGSINNLHQFATISSS